MALDRLLSLISEQGGELHRDTVARWTESPEDGAWDPEPQYGSFVDDEGRVILGSQPCRAFLDSSDPSALELSPQLARDFSQGYTVVFIDWGRQDLSWEEIFELWSAWDSQGMIADCGAVGVPWNLADRWVSPCWVAFTGDFDGSPLTTVSRPEAEAPSFLARARQLRTSAVTEVSIDDESPLPMLPFTLQDLRDPSRTWPQGLR